MDAFGPRIDARAAMRRDRADLLGLVTAFVPSDWTRPTVCGPWSVREVVAHVIGDDLGRLSRDRDGHAPDAPRPGEPLGACLARLNQRWVDACAHLAPPVLVELLTDSTDRVLAFWDTVDPDASGPPVSWVGPGSAPRWLDHARDFTEYWTHQRQLREAVRADRPADPEVDHVALDTFLRAVPHTLRVADAPEGATVVVDVTGPAGGTWTWERAQRTWWSRAEPPTTSPTARMTVADDVLWRRVTLGPDPGSVQVDGPLEITAPLRRIVSIVA